MVRMDPGAIGSAHECLVWTHLNIRSRGALHIFLPMWDMGVDAIVRRPDSDAMVPVQVKGRSSLGTDGILRTHVTANEATDDRVKVIVVLSDLDTITLRSPVLVMTVAQLKERSKLTPYGPTQAYPIEAPYPPGTRTRWRALSFPLDQLVDQVCPPGSIPLSAWPRVPSEVKQRARDTGYIGESTFINCAVATRTLNVFHAFPDLDFCEFLVRHLVTGGIHGVQVKCIAPDDGTAGDIHVRLGSFHASQRASLVVLGLTGKNTVHPECLVIPAADLPAICTISHHHLALKWIPGERGTGDQLGPYRLTLGELPQRLNDLAAADGGAP